MSDDLEARISIALSNSNPLVQDLAALVTETQIAIVESVAAVEALRLRALDFETTPKPYPASEAVRLAELARDRLKSALSQLQGKQAAAVAKGAEAEHFHDLGELERECVRLANELCAVYGDAQSTLTNFFHCLLDYRVRASRLREMCPAAIANRLRDPELVARGLDEFTGAVPSLVNEVRLPAFKPGLANEWPPKSKIESTLLAPLLARDPPR